MGCHTHLEVKHKPHPLNDLMNHAHLEVKRKLLLLKDLLSHTLLPVKHKDLQVAHLLSNVPLYLPINLAPVKSSSSNSKDLHMALPKLLPMPRPKAYQVCSS